MISFLYLKTNPLALNMGIWQKMKYFFCCGQSSDSVNEPVVTEIIDKENEQDNKSEIVMTNKLLDLTEFNGENSDKEKCRTPESIDENIQKLNIKATNMLEVDNMTNEEIEAESYIELKEYALGNVLPKSDDDRPTLVLDLDNTLINASTREMEIFDHEIIINRNEKSQVVWITERPGLKMFLNDLSEYYEVIVFTAGIRQYGIKVLEKIDPEKKVKYLLDRKFCTVIPREGLPELYVKNLDILGRDLSKTLFVDDREYSFCFHPNNGILVPFYSGNLEDNTLQILKQYLLECLNLSDLRARKTDCSSLFDFERK